jgi:hypothetical protein
MSSRHAPVDQERGTGHGPRDSVPDTARATSSSALRLARKGSGRVPTRPDPNADRTRGAGKISIELTKTQIQEVVRRAGDDGAASVWFSAVRDPDWTLALQRKDGAYLEQSSDKALSRSLLAGLLVLSYLSSLEGEYTGVVDIARRLGMNTSTTHRYMKTLVAVGLIERDPDSSKYRIAGIG